MPALNAQSAILNICREFSESRPDRKVVPSTPRLSIWAVLFRHNPVPGCSWPYLWFWRAKLCKNGAWEGSWQRMDFVKWNTFLIRWKFPAKFREFFGKWKPLFLSFWNVTIYRSLTCRIPEIVFINIYVFSRRTTGIKFRYPKGYIPEVFFPVLFRSWNYLISVFPRFLLNNLTDFQKDLPCRWRIIMNIRWTTEGKLTSKQITFS